MRVFIAALVMVIGLSGQVKAANYLNGNELHSRCQSNDNVCYHYVIGVFDAYLMFQDLDRLQEGKVDVCSPPSVTGQQVLDVTKKSLEENPSQRHFSAAGIVISALAEVWPCKK